MYVTLVVLLVLILLACFIVIHELIRLYNEVEKLRFWQKQNRLLKRYIVKQVEKCISYCSSDEYPADTILSCYTTLNEVSDMMEKTVL